MHACRIFRQVRFAHNWEIPRNNVYNNALNDWQLDSLCRNKTMNLRAISPLDGRYAARVAAMEEYLSEWALMKYRVKVELRWLIAMSEREDIVHVRRFSPNELSLLENMAAHFDDESAAKIKRFEAMTNHDVKAVEYYIKSRLSSTSLADVSESIHFACTSEDINNLAYALMLSDAMRLVWQPCAHALISDLDALAIATAEDAMLARTHGQAATPTTMGKELKVFVYRLLRQLKQIEAQEFLGKFNGAVGAYNAHMVAYPRLDWQAISRQFVEGLGLSYNPLTTQVESRDYLAELAHNISRYNTVLLDLCRDMWAYISLGYFAQKPVSDEVGSSTMPHKVNPINFENAEANLAISNSLLAHLADTLPVSRLQRDLSDSSALRNYGVAIAHSYLSLTSARSGLSKIELARPALQADLSEAWALLGEAVQTVLRKHHISGAYEQLKALTRGSAVSQVSIQEFIKTLKIPRDEKERLLQLSPETYIGYARELALAEIELTNERLPATKK